MLAKGRKIGMAGEQVKDLVRILGVKTMQLVLCYRRSDILLEMAIYGGTKNVGLVGPGKESVCTNCYYVPSSVCA